MLVVWVALTAYRHRVNEAHQDTQLDAYDPPHAQAHLRQHPASVHGMACALLKCRAIMELPLLRCTQAGSQQTGVVAAFYARALLALVREVVAVVPQCVVQLLEEGSHLLTGPLRYALPCSGCNAVRGVQFAGWGSGRRSTWMCHGPRLRPGVDSYVLGPLTLARVAQASTPPAT